jgi:aminodeoxychorismate synthase component I
MRIETIDGPENPLDVFLAIRHERLPFMLSGRDASGPGRGGLTYMGVNPFITIRTEGLKTSMVRDDGKAGAADDPFSALGPILSSLRREEGPYQFSGGAVGYFAYDLKTLALPRRAAPGTQNIQARTGAIGLPEAIIGIYDPIIVFEHATRKTVIISSGTGTAIKRAGFLSQIIRRLPTKLHLQRQREGAHKGDATAAPAFRPASNMTREGYVERVERARRYMADGDVYQINVAQRFETPFKGDPLALFARLMDDAPMPYAAYMDFGRFQLISNSPERLLSKRGPRVLTEPIKGTRPRGKTPEEDSALAGELSKSPKEQAEHVMVVDLERNDLGQCSAAGSISVDSFARIETYPGLHHMVSTVSGRLKTGMDTAACLKKIFPGGSITGAPKLRAMEIIDELEPTPREIYTGALGWMDLSGSADVAMAIRTAVAANGKLFLGVGSGIVADSVAEDEYDETLVKAAGFFDAVAALSTKGKT